MELEKRVAALEDAHDALVEAHLEVAAQITALRSVFIAIAPYLCPPSEQLRGALNSAYDTTSSLAEKAGQDSEHQVRVLAMIRELSETIYAGANTPSRPHTSDESGPQP